MGTTRTAPKFNSERGVNVNHTEYPRQSAAPTTPAVAGAKIYTFNADGNTVLEGRTESGGRFRFLRDQLFIGRNNTGSTIAKGTCVRISGWDATNLVVTIAVADNTTEATMQATGIATADILNNTSGRCWQIGLLNDVNTSGMAVGAPIYLSAAGAYTTTRPATVGHFRQHLGEVLVTDATVGKLFLSIGAGYETIAAAAGLSGYAAQTGANSIFGAAGACDPARMARELDMGAVAGPTPAGITATVMRAVKFRLPVALTLSQVSLLGVATVTNGYSFGIYSTVQGTARIWGSANNISQAANTWNNIAVSPTVVLAANTDYWFGVTNNNGAGTAAGYRSPPAPLGTNQFGAGAAPLGGRSLGISEYVQFATTSGALPATTPAVAAAAYAGGTTGTVPGAFFIGTV